MSESAAAKLAAGYTSRKVNPEAEDLKGSGLPAKVQEAVLDVVKYSVDLGERVAFAEKLHASAPDDELALEPGNHGQSTQAYRFEEVGGEIVEIRKDSHDAPVQIIHRPDLTPPDEVDPRAALQARLQAPAEPEPEQE